jgi:hypothetical protein
MDDFTKCTLYEKNAASDLVDGMLQPGEMWGWNPYHKIVEVASCYLNL